MLVKKTTVKTKKIILDPVMIAKGGFKLINDKAAKTLKNKLIKIECSANIYIYILAYEQNIFLMIYLP